MTDAKQTSPWNVPNALTVLRILMVPIFGWLLLADGGQNVTLRLWAIGVFLLAMLTDKIDGDIARKYNIVTDFGKLADPIADKALMATAFIGLAIVGALWWWVPVVILLREFGITVLRMVMVRRGFVMPASKGGKLKTVLQTGTVTLYLAILPLNQFASDGFMYAYAVLCGFMLAVTVIVTLVTGADYCWQAYKLTQNAEVSAAGSERPAAAGDAEGEAGSENPPASGDADEEAGGDSPAARMNAGETAADPQHNDV